MNWSNIKNIMIALLVLINVFLVGDMAFTNYVANTLPKGMAESVESIFEKNSITIEKGLLPTSYEERRKVDISFYSIDSLAQMLLGRKVEYKSDGQNVIAEKDGCTLTINGHYFTYKTPYSQTEASGRKILKALGKAGFSNEGMMYDNGFVTIKIDGFMIDGLYLEAALADDGSIAALSGVWGKVNVSDETEKATFVSAVPPACAALPQGAHIKNIEGVYVISGSGQNYIVKPAWKLTADDKEYIVS